MLLGLAEPALVLAAIFAILFMLAWQTWGTAITNTLQVNIPFIGNVIGRLVSEALEAAYGASVGFFDNIVSPAINLVLGPVAAVENMFFAVGYTLDAYAAAIIGLASNQIPGGLAGIAAILDSTAWQNLQAAEIQAANAFQDARDIASAVEDDIQLQFSLAEQYTDQRISYVLNLLGAAAVDLTQVTALATTAAQTVLASAETAIDNQIQLAYTDATAYAASLVTGVERDISSALATAEQFTTTAIGGAAGIITTDIDNAIAGALGGIYTDIDTAISDLVGVIGTTDADILAGVRAIPVSIPLDLAGVIAMAGATTLILTRYLKDCGIPNCQNLSQLGKDVQALLGLVDDASFLAFLTQIIQHPSDAPGVVSDTFGSAIDDTVNSFRSLVGV